MESTQTEAINTLFELAADLNARTENEAETRHKIIDIVLHQVLSWPSNRVSVEEYIRPGFADYVLKKDNGEHLILVEAKRSGVYFALPLSHRKAEHSCFIEIEKLLSDPAIRDAMSQVRAYCMDTGGEFAAITNGHEWIFFKVYEKGRRWESLKAFVVRNLEFFRSEYTKAINTFSYIAITEQYSLARELTGKPSSDRNVYYAKERIPSYSHAINSNRLASTLRPIATRYFGVIGDDDAEFMDRCYVAERDFAHAFDGMRGLIQDSLTPYLKEYGVQQLEDTGKGGRLGGRLTKALKRGQRGEVLVLFGGKGAGKSTFIKRLLHHNPPRWLREHAVIVIIDLLKTPEERSVIRAAIWDELISGMDKERILESDRDFVISKLFHDRYLIASRQELSGLSKSSEVYNTRLNALVSEWKADKSYCAARLMEYWSGLGKGLIVAIDNTDQFSGDHQDFCFTSAQEIAASLGSVTLISMREERFHNSKIHGLLDAFQNAGFHISSPKPAEVFRKRLSYTIDLLESPRKRARIGVKGEDSLIKDCCSYLRIISREFSNERSPLNSFLTACAHGDTRLSLDLFRSFLLSGYTNVEEMLAAGNWNFQIHQVIKPVMIPTRYFYDEKLSDIPNIYQLRDSRNRSHFTGLRILRRLAKSVDRSAAAYVTVAELKAYFAETFGMLDDFVKNLDVLLRHGFVESNNRIDSYSESVDSVKITSYGLYMYDELAYNFSYLDLVCVDCGVFVEGVSNYMTEAAKREYNLFVRDDRVARVEVRVNRVSQFIKYLMLEERRERDLYSLGFPDNELFSYKAEHEFDIEQTRILSSARRQMNKKQAREPRPGRTPNSEVGSG